MPLASRGSSWKAVTFSLSVPSFLAPGLPSTSKETSFSLAVGRSSACSHTWGNPVSAMLLGRTCPTAAGEQQCRKLLGWWLGGVGSPEMARAGARRAGSPYPAAPLLSPQQSKVGAGKKGIPRMREVVFRLEAERPGHLEAQAECLPIRITAPTLEELQHEAREALIEHMGSAHGTVRVRVRRPAALCH
jgi:hypothetical protein